MKVIGGVIVFILGLLLIVVSFKVVPLGQITAYVEKAYENPLFLFSLGAVLVLIVFLALAGARRRAVRSRGVSFNNPDGQVKITLLAIEDFVKKNLSGMGEIREVKPRVKVTAKGVRILNKVTLWSGTNLPMVSEDIQGLIKKKLEDILGIENVAGVDVFVNKIIERKKGKESAKEGFTGNIEYSE